MSLAGFGTRCICDVGVDVPSSTLEEQSVDVRSVDGSLLVGSALLQRRQNAHVVVHLVNGNLVLAREVLKRACQEGLRKVESAKPVLVGGCARVHPRAEEGEPLQEVVDPAPERFERRVRSLGPDLGDLSRRHGHPHGFQLGAHDHQPLEGALDLEEAFGHDARKLVEANELLREHGVHGLFVLHREV
eukprot:scaffold7375_cov268-Pinguiococcus_pyrenoidosus.AAC.38